jgi:hypothetical protein
MTLAEIIIDLKNMIGPAGKGSEVSDSGLKTWANEAYMKCVSTINNAYPDFFTKKVTTNLIASQNEYDLPSNFEKAIMVSVSYDGASFVKATALNNINQATDLLDTASQQYTTANPFYYIWNGVIGLQPTPSSTVSNGLKFWYTYSPSIMDEDSDTPDLPVRFHYIFKLQMFANYLDQNDDHTSAERMRQRFEREMTQLTDQLSQRVVDENRTVQIVDNTDIYLYNY